jgi:hypothetical protein
MAAVVALDWDDWPKEVLVCRIEAAVLTGSPRGLTAPAAGGTGSGVGLDAGAGSGRITGLGLTTGSRREVAGSGLGGAWPAGIVVAVGGIVAVGGTGDAGLGASAGGLSPGALAGTVLADCWLSADGPAADWSALTVAALPADSRSSGDSSTHAGVSTGFSTPSSSTQLPDTRLSSDADA